jgi:hypothetical protein
MRRLRVSAQLSDNRGAHEGIRTTPIGVAGVHDGPRVSSGRRPNTVVRRCGSRMLLVR